MSYTKTGEHFGISLYLEYIVYLWIYECRTRNRNATTRRWWRKSAVRGAVPKPDQNTKTSKTKQSDTAHSASCLLTCQPQKVTAKSKSASPGFRLETNARSTPPPTPPFHSSQSRKQYDIRVVRVYTSPPAGSNQNQSKSINTKLCKLSSPNSDYVERQTTRWSEHSWRQHCCLPRCIYRMHLRCNFPTAAGVTTSTTYSTSGMVWWHVWYNFIVSSNYTLFHSNECHYQKGKQSWSPFRNEHNEDWWYCCETFVFIYRRLCCLGSITLHLPIQKVEEYSKRGYKKEVFLSESLY